MSHTYLSFGEINGKLDVTQQKAPAVGMRGRCRFRKPSLFDSRSPANQNMIAA